MFKFTTRLTSQGYDCKPTSEGTITNQLKDYYCNLTPAQLAEYICYGYTICPSYPNMSVAEKMPISYIGFDFDHTDVCCEDRLNMVLDQPTIAYETFSCTEHEPRYRFIYVFSQPTNGFGFSKFRNSLIYRNGFDDQDPRATNINRYFHGTNRPVFYSGIVYDGSLNAFKLEEERWIDRQGTPAPIPPSKHTADGTCKVEESDISKLVSIGVSQELAKFYFSHSWRELEAGYHPAEPIKYESDYIQVENENYAVAPEKFYSVPRRYKHCRNSDDKYDVRPFKWKDGENRGSKLYQAIITFRILNPQMSSDDLLYYALVEFLTYYENRNKDGRTFKYNRVEFAHQFVRGMKADITIERKPLRHPKLHITSALVNKRAEVPKALAKERHKKIMSLYDSGLSMDDNLKKINETLGLNIAKRTLQGIVSGSLAPAVDRENVFKLLYNPDKSDADNLATMQDNTEISRATYYRLKKRFVDGVSKC